MSRFVNPYTFIPLSKRTRAMGAASAEAERLYSGVISCKLTAMTPIIIPGRKIEADDLLDPKHPVAPFFRVGSKPVIPASSLRGPIRAMYEALTNSCFRTNDTRLRSAGGRKIPGIVEWHTDEGFVLYEANRYRIKDADLCEGLTTGDEVYIHFTPEEGNGIIETAGIVDSISREPQEGTTSGVFLQVNTFIGDKGKTNRPSVFVKLASPPTPLDDDCVNCLKESIADYEANNNGGAEPEISQCYKTCLDKLLTSYKGSLPVWQGYERRVDGTWAIQLAQAQLSRSVFPQSPVTFATSLGLGECGKQGSVPCPACALFGYVGDKYASSQAGHVRFTDATPIGDIEFEQVALPALLGPRQSAFEFYLRNDNRRSKNSFTPETPGTQLSGRKAYWHSRKGIAEVDMNHLTGFESRAEAASVGSSFLFDIYFDKIGKKQLNQLVYTLSLGGIWSEATGAHYHKIGHGKPVGAGSAQVEVLDVMVRSVQESCYAIDDWESLGLKFHTLADVEASLSNVSEVMKVTDFNAIPDDTPVDYPRTKTGGDIFEWFGDNRKRTENEASPTLPIYKQVLPRITDHRQTLDS